MCVARTTHAARSHRSCFAAHSFTMATLFGPDWPNLDKAKPSPNLFPPVRDRKWGDHSQPFCRHARQLMGSIAAMLQASAARTCSHLTVYATLWPHVSPHVRRRCSRLPWAPATLPLAIVLGPCSLAGQRHDRAELWRCNAPCPDIPRRAGAGLKGRPRLGCPQSASPVILRSDRRAVRSCISTSSI
jgi:hypothetical protein